MPEPSPPEVGTVVMATRNRAHRVCHSVDQLLEHGDGWRVVVVDDASEDRTAHVVERRYGDRVRVLRLERNLGAAARNVGVAHARTELVAFADDDSWWAPGSLSRAAATMRRHGDVGLLTGSVLVGPEQRLDPILAEQLGSSMPCTPAGRRVLGFLACAAVVRRRAFLDADGFEELLHIGGEEELLAIDLRRSGWDLVVAPEVVVHHHPEPRGSAADARGRARRDVNHVLVAWMRRPLRTALAHSAALGRRAAHDPITRDALPWFARRLRGAFARRHVVPEWLDEELTRLEEDPP